LKQGNVPAGGLEALLKTSWGGHYFALDVGSGFNWTTHVPTLRRNAAEWEQKTLTQVQSSRSSRYPELQEVRWMKIGEALQTLRNPLAGDARRFMRSELQRFAAFVFQVAGAGVGVQRENFTEALVAYMEQQDVDDNTNALEELIKRKRT